jgi:hypothetical protein
MNITATLDSLEIESEDDGFHLVAEDNDGNRYNFRIHGIAPEFAVSKGLAALLDYRMEFDNARREHSQRVTDDELAYERSDPKHPDFAASAAQRADLDRKRERGE